jgi:hypothetical protein
MRVVVPFPVYFFVMLQGEASAIAGPSVQGQHFAPAQLLFAKVF